MGHIDGWGGARNAVALSYATPSHAVTEFCKVKGGRTAKEKKQRSFSKSKNKQKRLKSAETIVPALSIGVRTAEEQNIALSAALRERALRTGAAVDGERLQTGVERRGRAVDGELGEGEETVRSVPLMTLFARSSLAAWPSH